MADDVPQLGYSPETPGVELAPMAMGKLHMSSPQVSQLPSPPLSPETRMRDIEAAYPIPPPLSLETEKDPLLLRSKHTATAGPNEEGLRHRATLKSKDKNRKKLDRFYTLQDEHIDNLLKPIERHESEARKEEDESKTKVRIAVYASIIANFALAGLQLYAAASSLSLSFFATCVELGRTG